MPIRSSVAVGLAAAATLGLALLVAALAGLPAAIAVTGVANVILAARSMSGLRPARRFAELPVVALLIVVAVLFGRVLVALPPLGAVLLAVAVAASVLARRLGPRGRRIGRLAAAPFVSVLVVPAPAIAAGPGAALAVPLVAIAGQALTALALTALRVRTEAVEAPAPPGRPRSAGRLDAPTRQALQILLALLAAFAVGFLLFGRHWAWVVITAYVVQIGARGRGHAALTAVERLGGALGGTAAGMAAAAVPLPDPVRVALILLVLVSASALRSRSYVWWAAGVTASLALLYDVLGRGSPADLLPRLLAVIVGGLIAAASSWFVLPVRSRDVLRRRVADLLAATQVVLGAIRAEEAAPLGPVCAALARLEELTTTHRAQAWIARVLRRTAPPEAAVLERAAEVGRRLKDLVAGPPERGIGALEKQVGALRRLNGRREGEERPAVPPLPLGVALDALWEPLERLR
ncbi:FUSC family protein [Amnibacterium kyonggiense]|uniref:Fusaric acid resistance family protein n=1 Tax=Amnibacterium kyonggiense TaxID=595671 RepID=A0A4R7FHX2_9MICO|nr:FUSC family protein [Amnibacterium kyonggiense]TDS75007.1 fusaric acid resistance family protein [Amnibacterium kyonggiense]